MHTSNREGVSSQRNARAAGVHTLWLRLCSRQHPLQLRAPAGIQKCAKPRTRICNTVAARCTTCAHARVKRRLVRGHETQRRHECLQQFGTVCDVFSSLQASKCACDSLVCGAAVLVWLRAQTAVSIWGVADCLSQGRLVRPTAYCQCSSCCCCCCCSCTCWHQLAAKLNLQARPTAVSRQQPWRACSKHLLCLLPSAVQNDQEVLTTQQQGRRGGWWWLSWHTAWPVPCSWL
jgi:hypothetical protein